MTDENGTDEKFDSITGKIFDRLASFKTAAAAAAKPPPPLPPISPNARQNSIESLTREDSYLAPDKTPLSRSKSHINDKNCPVGPQRSLPNILLDRKKSVAFFNVSEDIQKIIVEHSDQVSVDLNRSLSNLSASDDDLSIASTLRRRRTSLDEMIDRLPYDQHFKETGVANLESHDMESQSCTVDDLELAKREKTFTTLKSKKLSLDRRIIELNELDLDDNVIHCNQMKLVIVGHHQAASQELTALLSTATNMLNDRCRTVGLSLTVFNTSWKIPNDFAPEPDHIEQMKALERFLIPDGSLVVILVLLNDKFGQWLLPTTIPENIYKYIYDSISKAQQKAMEQMASLNRQHMKMMENSPKESPRSIRRDSGVSKSADVEPGDGNEKGQEGRGGEEEEEERPESQTPSTRFRSVIRKFQSHSLILKSVLKDFDPFKFDPGILKRWYEVKHNSTSFDFHLKHFK